MLAYVTNWAGTFDLTAAEIIYLKDLGVSQSVVTAMLQHDGALKGPAAEATPTTPAPVRPTVATTVPPAEYRLAPAVPDPNGALPEAGNNPFYDALSPYGDWVQAEDYGPVWRPAVEVANPSWQPYFDDGHWLYSDCGWYWASDYSWGWAPFHYGRWFHHAHWGWCWAPDSVWGPSWVCWRYTSGFCGWAPLPPGAQYQPGIGLMFGGQRAGVTCTFGLGASAFAFVPWGHFHDHGMRQQAVDRKRAESLFQQSAAATRYAGGSHTLSNYGISREHVAAATHTAIVPVSLREAAVMPAHGTQSERLSPDGRTILVSRPVAAETFHPAPLGGEAGAGESLGFSDALPSTSVARDGARAGASGTGHGLEARPQSHSSSSLPGEHGLLPAQPSSPAPRPAYTPPVAPAAPPPVAAPRTYSPPPPSPAPAPAAPAASSGSSKTDQRGR